MTDQKIELYGIFVQTITAAERMRRQSSAIYASIVSAGVVLLGATDAINKIFIVLPILGVCALWIATIYYFRNLASAKFKVIKELEKDWDIKPFGMEREENKKHLLEGKLTYIEISLPALVFIVSFGFLIYLIYLSL